MWAYRPAAPAAQVWGECMAMLAEAGDETLPAVAELATGVTRAATPDGGDSAAADERRRWSLMQGVGSRRLHLVSVGMLTHRAASSILFRMSLRFRECYAHLVSGVSAARFAPLGVHLPVTCLGTQMPPRKTRK